VRRSVEHAIRDTSAIRWAGGGLALSGTIALVTSLLFGSAFGAVAASDPALGITASEWAEHLREDRVLRTWLWSVELAAQAILSGTALVLMAESRGGALWLPRQGAWAAIATGAVVQVVMISTMLGGYPAALDTAEGSGALLESLTGVVAVLATISTGTILVGLMGVLIGETQTAEFISRRVGWVGVGICATGTTLLLAGSAGVTPRLIVVPFALLARVLMIYLGVQLFRSERSV
jgi:hypothetical protein